MGDGLHEEGRMQEGVTFIPTSNEVRRAVRGGSGYTLPAVAMGHCLRDSSGKSRNALYLLVIKKLL